MLGGEKMWVWNGWRAAPPIFYQNKISSKNKYYYHKTQKIYVKKYSK